MKKTLTILALLLLGVVAAFAQTAPTFPYQSVVRNANNRLVQDSVIVLEIKVLEGAEERYEESRTVRTDHNGMVSFQIGSPVGRASYTGDLNAVTDWSDAKFQQTYHLAGGDIVIIDPVSPVPYALQAANSAGSTELTNLSNRVNTFNTNVCDSVAACLDGTNNALSQQIVRVVGDTLSSGNSALNHIVDTIAGNVTSTYLTTNNYVTMSQVSDTIGNYLTTNNYTTMSQVSDTIGNYLTTNNYTTMSQVSDTIGNYLTTNNYVTTTTMDGRHYLTSDSAVITTMQSNITALQAATVGNITLSNLCTSIESTCTNVALQNGDNTFAGSNTYTGTNDFTGGTTTVASVGDVYASMDSGTDCYVAVNYCGLNTVFDSIQRALAELRTEVGNLRDTLNQLRAANLPTITSINFTNKTSRRATATAVCNDGGATITDYTFSISENSDMSSPIGTYPNGDNPVCSFTGLQPAHTYYVDVIATNLKGRMTSVPYSFTTPAEMPTAGELAVAPADTAGFSVEVPDVTTGGAANAQARVCYGMMTGSDCSSVTYDCTAWETIAAGTYSKSVTHLSQPGATYCVKTEIATNDGDSLLSLGPKQVTIPTVAPTLGTISVPAKTANSLTVSVPVTDNGGAPITGATLCAYTNAECTEPATPVCASSVDFSTSPITGTISGLAPGTAYYVKATATNDGKTGSSAMTDPVATDFAKPTLATPVTLTADNTSISVEGSVISFGGTASATVKVCAYTTSDYSGTPICSPDSTVTAEPQDYKVTVSGLTKNTHYYLAVIADNGHKTDTVKTSTTTLNTTLTITRNPSSDAVKLCGGGAVVTYTATVTAGTATSYTWSTSGGTATTSTTSTYTVTYTSAATYTVSCTANGAGVSATSSVSISGSGTAATLGLCEDCNAGSITMKSGNCTSLTWVNDADPTKTGTVSSVTTGSVVLTVSSSAPAGVYTFTGTNSDGCSVSRSATLGNATSHPCTVTRALNQTDAATHKNYEWGITSKLDSVSDHEGNVYRVVQIGTQCWLAENMRCTTSPSTNHIIVFGSASAYVSSSSSKCAINHNYSKYGVLYNWCAAVDTFYANSGQPELANAHGHNSTDWSVTMPSGNRRGICPEGWHIPTDAEWTSMASLAGVGQGIGTGVSKLSGGCDWSSQSSGTYPGSYSDPDRNSTGFSALPAGYCKSSGSGISRVGNNVYFWSATPNTSFDAWSRGFNQGSQFVNRDCNDRYYALSVRCLRD